MSARQWGKSHSSSHLNGSVKIVGESWTVGETLSQDAIQICEDMCHLYSAFQIIFKCSTLASNVFAISKKHPSTFCSHQCLAVLLVTRLYSASLGVCMMYCFRTFSPIIVIKLGIIFPLHHAMHNTHYKQSGTSCFKYERSCNKTRLWSRLELQRGHIIGTGVVQHRVFIRGIRIT